MIGANLVIVVLHATASSPLWQAGQLLGLPRISSPWRADAGSRARRRSPVVEIAPGTTVFELLTLLREQDARLVAVACTHGLFADGALDKLAACDVTEIVCTNSAPVPADHPKLHLLSVAPALAEAINRIHNGESSASPP